MMDEKDRLDRRDKLDMLDRLDRLEKKLRETLCLRVFVATKNVKY